MAQDNHETNLRQLGRMWREKLKNIRSRAKENQKSNSECSSGPSAFDDLAQIREDSELFASAVSAQLIDTKQIPTMLKECRRLSMTQKVLVAGIILVASMLLYVLLKPRQIPVVGLPRKAATRQTTSVEGEKVEEEIQKSVIKSQKQGPDSGVEQSVSLKLAQSFYNQADYTRAYAVYRQLCQGLTVNEENEPLRDFLRLKMAVCMMKTGDYEQAAQLLNMISKSYSPAVAVIANYHLGLLEKQKKQYLSARTRAYCALALISLVDFDKNVALAFQRDCYYLAAETMTREALSLSDVNQNIPQNLWNDSTAQQDLLVNLNEAQLRSFLNSGSRRLSNALLGPEIRQDSSGSMRRWSVICHRAPIDELLAKVASNAGLDVHWTLDSKQTAVRQHAVSLYLPLETEQQILTVASGCAGLVAALDENGIVNIYNPTEYSYLSEQISLLNSEAMSLWQKFLVTFQDDRHLANAHFALGLLHAQARHTGESIAEYKLVANRFPGTSLAPFALLNSSRQKNSLRDYSGAQKDLQQLIEQYPDSEIVGQAYSYLADNVTRQGSKIEAAKIYCKIYNFNLSSESQIDAAFAAGKSFYDSNDFQSAVKWLTQYISLAKDRDDKNLHSAYFLLGKIRLAMGKPETACEAFRCALSGQLSREEHIETLQALVEGYMEQQRFVEAIGVLEDAYSLRFSQTESVQILLLKSRVLRAMGLIDKAIAMLGERSQFVDDIQLKTEIDFEFSQCCIEKGDLNLAYKKLSEILALARSGPLAYKTAYTLGEVCFQLGQYAQTISVCLQLLDLQPSEQIKQDTLKLLARAYCKQKDYDRAALAFFGRWK